MVLFGWDSSGISQIPREFQVSSQLQKNGGVDGHVAEEGDTVDPEHLRIVSAHFILRKTKDEDDTLNQMLSCSYIRLIALQLLPPLQPTSVEQPLQQIKT